MKEQEMLQQVIATLQDAEGGKKKLKNTLWNNKTKYEYNVFFDQSVHSMSQLELQIMRIVLLSVLTIVWLAIIIVLIVNFYEPIPNFFLEPLAITPWFYTMTTFCYFMTILQLIMTIRAGTEANADDVNYKKDATICLEISFALNMIQFIYFFTFTTQGVSLVGDFVTTLYNLLPFIAMILDLIMTDVIFFFTDFWIIMLMILLYVPFNNSGQRAELTPVYDQTDWDTWYPYVTFVVTLIFGTALHCLVAWITQVSRGRNEFQDTPYVDTLT